MKSQAKVLLFKILYLRLLENGSDSGNRGSITKEVWCILNFVLGGWERDSGLSDMAPGPRSMPIYNIQLNPSPLVHLLKEIG